MFAVHDYAAVSTSLAAADRVMSATTRVMCAIGVGVDWS